MLNLMAAMFILMAAGYAFRKAFSQKLETDMFQQFLTVLLVGVVCLLTRILYAGERDGLREVYQYGTVCSNSGFMGNPLAEGIFGNIGLVYASIFLIPQRIVIWTAGATYFQHGTDQKSVYRKVLTHPCMVATYTGVLIMVLQLNLPDLVMSPLLACSNCTTAMTMVYIGTILVEVEPRSIDI